MAITLSVMATRSPTISVSVKCPAGESDDTFTGVCVPEVDGVPCAGGNSYEWIGLTEESLGQGPTPSPILPPPPSP
jgi:hypothetical protein